MSLTEPPPYPTNLTGIVRFIRDRMEGEFGWYIMWLSVLSLIYFYTFIPAFLAGLVVDNLSSDIPDLRWCFALAAILGVSWAITAVLRLHVKSKIQFMNIRTGSKVRVQGFERLLSQRIEKRTELLSGSTIQKLQTGSVGVQELLNLWYTSLLDVLVNIVGALAVFLFMDWRLFLFAAGYVSGPLIIQRHFTARLRTEMDRFLQRQEKAAGSSYEGISNILTVQALGVERNVRKNIERSEREAREQRILVAKMTYAKWRLLQIFGALAFGGFLSLLIVLASNNTLGIGMVFVAFTYLRTLHERVANATDLVDTFLEHRAKVIRLFPIFEKDGPRGGDHRFPVHWSSLSLTGCTYRHPGAKSGGVHNLSLVIPRGQKIAVVGSSGSGKTTLSRILVGLYQLQEGTYQIDKVPFLSIRSSERAKHISLVLQEIELFSLSLRENVTMYREVTEENLMKAIRVANLLPVIERLPERLDTVIGEKGSRLSGGERQRIGIARALCGNPDILILDEATSNLDPITEKAFLKALHEEYGTLTVIGIAHRAATLEGFDRVIVLKEGQIVEDGSLPELRGRNSIFSKLFPA